ncbi:MAG: hypothetical protein KW788_00080 [Candidatus Doudnabacteria bacterium]|nr:hypothetical protein [Candidatus Doudnabacteria bacterium]
MYKSLAIGVGLAVIIFATFAFVFVNSGAQAAYCDQSSNGCEHSMGNTICAGHGAFGAFGEQGDVYHDFRGGANGDATAFNNSTLCGNPQGAAGVLEPAL